MIAVINNEGTPAQVLAACRAGKFVLVVSEVILEEVDRVLQYSKVARFHQWSEERRRTFVEDLAHMAKRTPGTRQVLAEEEGRIIGALRLCQEQGTLVLRGMRVQKEWQRQGVGTRLLQVANERIGQRTCYCLPHPYLEGLYGRIGFEQVKPASVPRFLRLRQVEYRERGVETLLILMKKASKPTRKR
ncbi:MAG: GNAT family N-acetyltransferase [Candidatus Latescibacteria bacterium]|nr:GNAT family N-acetyltransferase [Candidatus Latescibacterota bacterium]